MGQRNILYTGPILEPEHGHIHPEPCVVPYNGIPSFPQPTNTHTILPPPSGSRTSFIPQHLPENHGPLPHIDHHHPFMGARVFHHGMHGGFENCQFIDGFKRKNAGNIQYFYPTPGSSSSSAAVPMNTEGTMIPGNYSGQPFQAVPNPWIDQQFHAPGIPYLQGHVNGAAFVHPTSMTPHQGGPHNLHHAPPMPPMQVPNIDFQSRRLPTNNPFQNGTEGGPRFVGPIQPTGVRVFRPHRRELMVDAAARNRVFPHLRVLPEDGVAILDISGYHEVGSSVDQHSDMRLDIDHMSYEELLALGEQIGNVGSGLSDDVVIENLKTRVFATSISSSDASSADQELNSCVICQNNYDDQEQIGVLDCGHEYHVECVKKWLTVKNTCPICKSTALAAKAKES